MSNYKIPETLTVGPTTANLLLSLRSVEAAREYLCRYYNEQFGEETAPSEIEDADIDAKLFDPVRDFLERKIIDNIRYWANVYNPDGI